MFCSLNNTKLSIADNDGRRWDLGRRRGRAGHWSSATAPGRRAVVVAATGEAAGAVALGIALHAIYMLSIFDIYFKTPIVHGMEPVP